MALGPAIGDVVITTLFYNLEIRIWFSQSVKDAVVNSNIVASYIINRTLDINTKQKVLWEK